VLVYGGDLGVSEVTVGTLLDPAASDSCGVGYAYVDVVLVIRAFVACMVVSGTLLYAPTDEPSADDDKMPLDNAAALLPYADELA
jgi:hypothetical protein